MLTGAPRAVSATTVLALVGLVGTPASAQPATSCGSGQTQVTIGEVTTCVAYVDGVISLSDVALKLELRSTSASASASGSSDCFRPLGDDDNPGLVGPRTVPCYDETRGWYSRRWDCHFNLAPLDTAIDPDWPPYGYDPDDPPGGILFWASCYPPMSNEFAESPHWIPGDPPVWASPSLVVLPAPPDGFGGAASRLGELWVEAVNSLRLRGPEITTAPPLTSGGLVGLRTWLWTSQDDPHVWGVVTASADGRPDGLNEWIDMRAEPVAIEWDLGEPGRAPVRCDGPGQVYRPDLRDHWPECGFTYHQPSRAHADGGYPTTAITTWHVQWWVNGRWDGELDLRVGSATSYRVHEIQVLVGQPD